MAEVAKGSKTDLTGTRHTVTARTSAGPDLVDVAAVLLAADGRVRGDDDLVFFNNPKGPGVTLDPTGSVSLDLAAVPAEVTRIVVTGSTEAQAATFAAATDLVVEVADGSGGSDSFTFTPPGLTAETVLQMVAFYRRGEGWRLDAVGQGYGGGLAAFATEHGIDVSAPATDEVAAPAPPVEPVRIVLAKDAPDKKATIDLRKSHGDPAWVLTVGLEWDGREARYDAKGNVTRYGEGDLDVYFFCRNEQTDEYVVISGEAGHRGGLDRWPYALHSGDSRGPGHRNKPASEEVHVRPDENGDMLVNVYQSVDNGAGAIDEFGRPRVVVRYGRAGADGEPGPDADEIVIQVGSGDDRFWATVAHIDVQDGLLTVDGETRYSEPFDEEMPGLDTAGNWVRQPVGGPVGQSKEDHGAGLDRYAGVCPPPT
jgi:stress response protein SCP2